MSTLVNVPKGNVTSRNSDRTYNFPMWPSWMEDFLNRDLPAVFSQNFNTGMSMPMVNIKETPDSYYVEMAVPGMKKSDFQIDLDNQILSISTDIREGEVTKDVQFTRKEFGYSSFKRSFTLPQTVEYNRIKADYKEGILSIQLPKKEEAKQKPARSIKIT